MSFPVQVHKPECLRIGLPMASYRNVFCGLLTALYSFTTASVPRSYDVLIPEDMRNQQYRILFLLEEDPEWCSS